MPPPWSARLVTVWPYAAMRMQQRPAVISPGLCVVVLSVPAGSGALQNVRQADHNGMLLSESMRDRIDSL